MAGAPSDTGSRKTGLPRTSRARRVDRPAAREGRLARAGTERPLSLRRPERPQRKAVRPAPPWPPGAGRVPENALASRATCAQNAVADRTSRYRARRSAVRLSHGHRHPWIASVDGSGQNPPRSMIRMGAGKKRRVDSGGTGFRRGPERHSQSLFGQELRDGRQIGTQGLTAGDKSPPSPVPPALRTGSTDIMRTHRCN